MGSRHNIIPCETLLEVTEVWFRQTVSIYLVMPLVPAIVFGILSKRVTTAGALASVVVGIGVGPDFETTS
jgi:Na+/proline symporter